MILVDSSVWIDYFRGHGTPQADRLDDLLPTRSIAVGDLMLTEVLQDFPRQQDFDSALRLLTSLDVIEIVDRDAAIEAARNFRMLRLRGITIRKTIDTLITTRCILDRHRLLFSDRDFDPFVEHLGLERFPINLYHTRRRRRNLRLRRV